jgi:hypothetical protein
LKPRQPFLKGKGANSNGLIPEDETAVLKKTAVSIKGGF